MNTSKAFFVSDAHLGAIIPSFEHRQDYLFSFFSDFVRGSSHLFLVGDIFDFWVEYAHAIRPDYFQALHQLRNLVESGTEVHYLAGNHDFALGPFLEREVGIRVHADTLDITLQGRNIHLYHGDGLVKADVGYRILRKILRNPTLQKMYKLLHPNLGVALAGFCSGSSRSLLSLRHNPARLAEYRLRAHQKMNEGTDIVIYGHTHNPEITRWGDKAYCNTGGWIQRYTFAMLENGHINVYDYLGPGTEPVVLPPESGA